MSSTRSANVIPVVSLSTPHPRRVHLMDEDGMALCGAPLRFRRFDDRRDVPRQQCCPCRLIYLRERG